MIVTHLNPRSNLDCALACEGAVVGRRMSGPRQRRASGIRGLIGTLYVITGQREQVRGTVCHHRSLPQYGHGLLAAPGGSSAGAGVIETL